MQPRGQDPAHCSFRSALLGDRLPCSRAKGHHQNSSQSGQQSFFPIAFPDDVSGDSVLSKSVPPYRRNRAGSNEYQARMGKKAPAAITAPIACAKRPSAIPCLARCKSRAQNRALDKPAGAVVHSIRNAPCRERQPARLRWRSLNLPKQSQARVLVVPIIDVDRAKFVVQSRNWHRLESILVRSFLRSLQYT